MAECRPLIDSKREKKRKKKTRRRKRGKRYIEGEKEDEVE